MRQWIRNVYCYILKYSIKAENLYVSIRWVSAVGGYADIKVRPILMGKEFGRHLKYSPFARDIKDKSVIVLKLEDFLDIIKESEYGDELQIPFDRFMQRDISS